MMEPTAAGGDERERYWRLRLGRIRLGAEPLEEQLARYRKVAWGLTTVSGLIAALFVALFAAFHAPAVGLIVAGILLLPIVVGAWLEDWSLHRRVAAYRREKDSGQWPVASGQCGADVESKAKGSSNG